jgi:Domain of unknown function (DUF1816)
MSLAAKMFSLLGLKKEEAPYWLEINTKVPKCTYYFGPFDSPLEAEALQAGYIEDLIEEKAEGIQVELKQCQQPPELTICETTELFD